MVISRVMLWWKSLTACSTAMIKNKFNIPAPMDRAQGYRVCSTKLQVPEENAWGVAVRRPPMSPMALFQIPFARWMENPPRKSVSQSGIRSLLTDLYELDDLGSQAGHQTGSDPLECHGLHGTVG